MKQIKSALISVYYKDGLDEIIQKLKELNVTIYSTGGTYDFIKSQGVDAKTVESLTDYPAILGGRVKTLHPKVFGGILNRRENEQDQQQIEEYGIPSIDLVIVDLYPFEQTVASGASHKEIIEKIDIGGISLIRAAAKNFNDVVIVPSVNYYKELLDLLQTKNGQTDLEDRERFAAYAFHVSSHYDTAIFNYFNRKQNLPVFKQSIEKSQSLRYGENPHQKASFYGNLEGNFAQLHGKEISYNNLLDIDAAIAVSDDFQEPCFAILKHTNVCGFAIDNDSVKAWEKALAGDPISAFGGIIIHNREINKATAEKINELFFEVIIAPSYQADALEILKQKKNRIILERKPAEKPAKLFRSCLNGLLLQDRDAQDLPMSEYKSVTKTTLSKEQALDLVMANRLVKHSKSNAIVLAKNGQLLGSGVGQTSRVDALKQAIVKAQAFKLDLNGAVMASDAFFPFADCVEIAHEAGITAVIHPGGSLRDQDSVDYCEKNNMAMVVTGFRHFKH